ncbi:hypothetical protein HG530_009556 [Fusarium avenaceum]|nr:hypothetical protein HG530_009556 [Fusarium avenaceum]
MISTVRNKRGRHSCTGMSSKTKRSSKKTLMSCKHAPSPFIPFKYITSRHFRTVPWQNGDLILSSSPEEQKLELLQTSFAMLYPSLSERPLLASRPQDLNWAFVPTPAAEGTKTYHEYVSVLNTLLGELASANLGLITRLLSLAAGLKLCNQVGGLFLCVCAAAGEGETAKSLEKILDGVHLPTSLEVIMSHHILVPTLVHFAGDVLLNQFKGFRPVTVGIIVGVEKLHVVLREADISSRLLFIKALHLLGHDFLRLLEILKALVEGLEDAEENEQSLVAEEVHNVALANNNRLRDAGHPALVGNVRGNLLRSIGHFLFVGRGNIRGRLLAPRGTVLLLPTGFATISARIENPSKKISLPTVAPAAAVRKLCRCVILQLVFTRVRLHLWKLVLDALL